uniref:Uncharacterized protein n=1 Tax=Glossina austeni TaxID=7395 RepID=A0A1A9UFP2_GLOAU
MALMQMLNPTTTAWRNNYVMYTLEVYIYLSFNVDILLHIYRRRRIIVINYATSSNNKTSCSRIKQISYNLLSQQIRNCLCDPKGITIIRLKASALQCIMCCVMFLRLGLLTLTIMFDAIFTIKSSELSCQPMDNRIGIVKEFTIIVIILLAYLLQHTRRTLRTTTATTNLFSNN